jgi:hypothetical protein
MILWKGANLYQTNSVRTKHYFGHLDGMDAPRRHRCAKVVVLSNHQGRRPWARLAR